ncbi:DUF5368 domain-containing protein [Hyphomonadaceae bacterium ML37]|nr:DUF5368 domain-containing protein [Hyphomonadaceae bacterium ML37]
MQELDPAVLLAVLLEMMGAWFWLLLLLALAGLGGFGWVVWRERTVSSGRLVRAQAFALLAGAGALVLMAHVTRSGFTDAGGPVDWLLIGVIFAAGWAGGTILLYAAIGLWPLLPGRAWLAAIAARKQTVRSSR